jgi:hypothetical protein
MRAMVSVTPPAGTGTMSLTVPLGKLCALAAPLAIGSSDRSAASSVGPALGTFVNMTSLFFLIAIYPRCHARESGHPVALTVPSVRAGGYWIVRFRGR